MKLALGVLLFVAPVVTLADSLMPNLVAVGSYLQANSDLPITRQADLQLARNILLAQSNPACTYCGPESLYQSELSVLKAIDLYLWQGLPVSYANTPLVFLQSTIAINPDATVVITPDAINFGEVPVPEPSVWMMCLAALGMFFWLRKLTARIRERAK